MGKIEDIKYLEIKVKECIEIILQEYKEILPADHVRHLCDLLNNESNVLMSRDGINCFYSSSQEKIIFPLQYYAIIEELKKTDKRFSTEKNRRFVSDENKIVNDNNYFTFFEYAIVAGLMAREVFEMFTLHETMHLCGATGNDMLSEAFTELKTRELSLKYGIEAACCNYSDEVKIAIELQKIFGKDLCDKLIFVPNDMKMDFLRTKCKEEYAELYQQINVELNCQMHEYQNRRYSVDGINGVKTLVLLYSNKNYDGIYRMIEEFKSKYLYDNGLS